MPSRNPEETPTTSGGAVGAAASQLNAVNVRQSGILKAVRRVIQAKGFRPCRGKNGQMQDFFQRHFDGVCHGLATVFVAMNYGLLDGKVDLSSEEVSTEFIQLGEFKFFLTAEFSALLSSVKEAGVVDIYSAGEVGMDAGQQRWLNFLNALLYSDTEIASDPAAAKQYCAAWLYFFKVVCVSQGLINALQDERKLDYGPSLSLPRKKVSKEKKQGVCIPSSLANDSQLKNLQRQSYFFSTQDSVVEKFDLWAQQMRTAAKNRGRDLHAVVCFNAHSVAISFHADGRFGFYDSNEKAGPLLVSSVEDLRTALFRAVTVMGKVSPAAGGNVDFLHVNVCLPKGGKPLCLEDGFIDLKRNDFDEDIRRLEYLLAERASFPTYKMLESFIVKFNNPSFEYYTPVFFRAVMTNLRNGEWGHRLGLLIDPVFKTSWRLFPELFVSEKLLGLPKVITNGQGWQLSEVDESTIDPKLTNARQLGGFLSFSSLFYSWFYCLLYRQDVTAKQLKYLIDAIKVVDPAMPARACFGANLFGHLLMADRSRTSNRDYLSLAADLLKKDKSTSTEFHVDWSSCPNPQAGASHREAALSSREMNPYVHLLNGRFNQFVFTLLSFWSKKFSTQVLKAWRPFLYPCANGVFSLYEICVTANLPVFTYFSAHLGRMPLHYPKVKTPQLFGACDSIFIKLLLIELDAKQAQMKKRLNFMLLAIVQNQLLCAPKFATCFLAWARQKMKALYKQFKQLDPTGFVQFQLSEERIKKVSLKRKGSESSPLKLVTQSIAKQAAEVEGSMEEVEKVYATQSKAVTVAGEFDVSAGKCSAGFFSATNPSKPRAMPAEPVSTRATLLLLTLASPGQQVEASSKRVTTYKQFQCRRFAFFQKQLLSERTARKEQPHSTPGDGAGLGAGASGHA
jgi:hypothetical protein